MKKIIQYLTMTIVFSLIFAGCARKAPTIAESEKTPLASAPQSETPAPEKENKENKVSAEPLRIAALKGPTAMGMVKLMEDNAEESSNNLYNFEILGTADEVTAGLTKGELDIAAIPCNLASVLYNKEVPIKVAAINTLGVLYIVDKTDTIKSVEDLRGKTIYTVGQGTTPEFALNYVLTQNGLVVGSDVTVEFKDEATELAALLASGQGEIAMLPEPYCTTVLAQNADVKIALSLTEEWNKIQTEFSLLTGTVVIRSEVIENRPEDVSAFLAAYEQSIQYMDTNLEEGATLVEKYGIVPKAAIAKAAIPRCNIVFIDGDKMQTDIAGYLNVLFEAEPKAVGGKLPDENFYFKK